MNTRRPCRVFTDDCTDRKAPFIPSSAYGIGLDSDLDADREPCTLSAFASITLGATLFPWRRTVCSTARNTIRKSPQQQTRKCPATPCIALIVTLVRATPRVPKSRVDSRQAASGDTFDGLNLCIRYRIDPSSLRLNVGHTTSVVERTPGPQNPYTYDSLWLVI